MPWGGPSLRFVVAKGHESLSNQGSRRASDYLPDETAAYVTTGGGSDSGSRATETAGGATAEADAADYRYGDDSQMYSFASGDGSQAGSSRSSSDYAYTQLAEDPQYFGESPYYYD